MRVVKRLLAFMFVGMFVLAGCSSSASQPVGEYTYDFEDVATATLDVDEDQTGTFTLAYDDGETIKVNIHLHESEVGDETYQVITNSDEDYDYQVYMKYEYDASADTVHISEGFVQDADTATSSMNMMGITFEKKSED